MERDDDSEENEGAGVPPLEQAKSYGAYAVRSLRRHPKLAAFTFAGGVMLVTVGLVVWPRTYTCTTVLSAMDNKVLDGGRDSDAMRGVEEVVLNRTNIAAIVDEIKLAKRWDQTQPPITRLKGNVMSMIRGTPSERDRREALIQMVQNAISVTPPGWNQNKMTISADWHDPQIATDLADAADKSFLRARRIAEISTISEYITILEGHATALRAEIQSLAGQNQQARDDKLAELQRTSPAPARENPAPSMMAAPARPAAAPVDLSELKSQLEIKQRALKELEDAQQRRRSEAEAQLTELRTKFTGAHPMVLAAETNLASLSRDTAQTSTLRSDVAQLTESLRSKQGAAELAAKGGPRVGGVPPSSNTPGASGVEPLPAEIMRLMQEGNEELDPAVGALFRGAVAKFAAVRDKIGTARVDLDTAEAAFKHRYQIVIPAEKPSSPSKPKVPVMAAAGILGSVALGWLLAILAELRTGRIVERWQVYRLGVPLLGELRWPPSSGS